MTFTRRILCALMLLAITALTASASRRTYLLADYGILPNINENISPRLNELIAKIKTEQGPRDTITLVFTPGRYVMASLGSPERQVYISNHDQRGLRSIGILLEDVHDIEIEGMGAELLFLDRMLPIAILNGRNVQVRGLKVDFVSPQISQMRVVSSSQDQGTVLESAPYVQWRIDTNGRLECFGRDWKNNPSAAIAFDADTHHIIYNTSDIGVKLEGAEAVSDRQIRLSKWYDARLPIGTILAMRSWARPNPAFFVDNCRDTRLERVTVNYADGMGLIAQNSHNVALNRFDVRPSQGRYFSTQADATHFSGCSGHIEVINGEFEGMMDDAINVHGVYLRLMERVDDYTIVGRYMHNQAWGFEWGRVGDPVQFIASKTFEAIAGLNEIASITPEGQNAVPGAKAFRIKFKKKLPASITPEMSIGIENMRKIPSVVFSHNTIRNNRARGALFNSSRPIRVEYNVFDHISGAAIVSSTDCNQWFESGRTQQMLIRGNQFIDVLTSLFQFTEAVITLHPVIPELDKQKVPFYGDGRDGIKIEDNVFMTFDTPLLYAKSVDGLLWRRNKVIETTNYPKFHWNKERFRSEGSRALRIQE